MSAGFVWLALACSFAVGCFHLMRSHSGTAVLLFSMVLLLFTRQDSWRRKGLIVMGMFVMVAIPWLYTHSLSKQAAKTILAHEALYPPGANQHPFWHSVYIGFGFVNNPYVSAYKDEVAVEKVKSIDPSVGYLSKEYESILRREVFAIHNIAFWIMNIGAKGGVVVVYLLLFANVGVVLRLFSRGGHQCELAFIVALSFSAVPGVLIVPYRAYLLGMIAFAVLYNIVTVNMKWTQEARLCSGRAELGSNGSALRNTRCLGGE